MKNKTKGDKTEKKKEDDEPAHPLKKNWKRYVKYGKADNPNFDETDAHHNANTTFCFDCKFQYANQGSYETHLTRDKHKNKAKEILDAMTPYYKRSMRARVKADNQDAQEDQALLAELDAAEADKDMENVWRTSCGKTHRKEVFPPR